MYNLSVKNSAGDVLRLTANENYAVIGVTGLTPVAANINTSTAGINDGVLFNSARLDYRNIVITIRFPRDVEKNRIRLYRYFQPKNLCTLYFNNGARNVYITGYVETFECDLFTLGQVAQISIICPDPYFKSVNETIRSWSTVTAAFEFPTEFNNVILSEDNSGTTVSVPNNGDVSAGMDIELSFTGNVENPVIRNANTGEFLRLNRNFVSGNVVKINTRKGNKSVILRAFGRDLNIINAFSGAWLQLQCGKNTMLLGAESGTNNFTATFKHSDLFSGV